MTTVHIHLPDDHAAAMRAEAASHGMTLEDWIQKLAEQALPGPLDKAPQEREPVYSQPPWRHISEIIAERMQALPPEVFDGLPKDGASEHDYYLYGWPEKNQ